MDFNSEMIDKARHTKTVEELEALIQEEGLSLTRSELMDAFAKTHPKIGELTDDELDDVAGGCPDKGKPDTRPSCCLCDAKGVHLNETYVPTSAGPSQRLVCDACWNKYPSVPDLWAALAQLQP